MNEKSWTVAGRVIGALIAAAIAIGGAAASRAATTGGVDGAFFPGGTYLELLLTPYCYSPYSCAPVPTTTIPGFEVSDAARVATWIQANPDAQIIVGHSYGSEVLYRLQREYADGSRALPDQPLIFVGYGNPENKVGGQAYFGGFDNLCGCGVGLPDAPLVEQWEVIAQYDFYADYPNVPSSPYYALAVMNAWLGGFSQHVYGYLGVDPFDPTLLRWVDPADGTTYVFLPTNRLPILFGLPNATLQARIETAYDRPDYQIATTTKEVVNDPASAPVSTAVSPVYQQAVEAVDDRSESDSGVQSGTEPDSGVQSGTGLQGGLDDNDRAAAELHSDDATDAAATPGVDSRRGERGSNPVEAGPSDSAGRNGVVRRSLGAPDVDTVPRRNGVERTRSVAGDLRRDGGRQAGNTDAASAVDGPAHKRMNGR